MVIATSENVKLLYCELDDASEIIGLTATIYEYDLVIVRFRGSNYVIKSRFGRTDNIDFNVLHDQNEYLCSNNEESTPSPEKVQTPVQVQIDDADMIMNWI